MPSACSSSTRRRDGREDKEVCRVRLRTASLPRLCGARSAPYYCVYPKTVRRTVVLCRGGPRGRPPPGNHKQFVGCACAPVALPRLCGARSAPYYCVYPKTVRRTVVLCRGGPRGRPPPGNHKQFVGCACAPVALPRLCGARSAPYYCVYPKTVRRTVVLCRGGPRGRPPPGNHKQFVGCACAPVALPRLCGARSAPYYCVYPKTVRRTVVLCRGGPRGRPPPGNHKQFVGCACAPVALPRLCGARSAPYYCVYPKTVRRTVVLCRGGPRGRPPPGNHKQFVGCACAPVALPRLCGARSAPYYRVYPKTVRRTVVLCRGGPRGRPPPGNHKGCPYGCTSAFGLRMVAGMNFSVASPYVQIYRRRGTTSSFPVHLSVSNLNCVPCA